jgi:phosphate transport system permease protein
MRRCRWAVVSNLSVPHRFGRFGGSVDAAQWSPRLRRLRGAIFWTLCGLALAMIVFPLIDMVWTLVVQALPVLRPIILVRDTQGLGIGLSNGILGSLVLALGVLVVGSPVGVLAGLYIAEFAGRRPRALFRFFSEVLSGVPSIVIGLVGYVALVNFLHWHYSLLAAVLALSVIIVPYITKTTEVAFESVPRSLREGAAALGLSRLTTIRKVLLPPALPAIVGGLVLAQAIAIGETAPLLFTAEWSDSNPVLRATGSPEPYITGITWNGLILPQPYEHELAAGAGLVTVFFVLILILLGRAVTARSRRLTARMDL